jgi:broad specificity phosphatase PhoE
MEIIFVRHAQTQMNVEKRAYDNFGKDEYYPLTDIGIKQAITTGKYLKKYGKFDKIISSPRDRCIETANNIAKQINYKKDLEIDKRLLENKAGIFNGMNKDEMNKIFNSNKKYKKWKTTRDKLNDNIKKSKTEFEKYKYLQLLNTHYEKSNKMFKSTMYVYINKQQKSFLNYLKKQNYKRVLVVLHGGSIYRMYMNMVPNLMLEMFDMYDESVKKESNCVMFGAIYDDNKYIALTKLHTKQFE